MISTTEQSSSQAQSGSADIEPRMFQFLDAMPVGVFIGLPGGRPYYANNEAIRLLGRGVLPSAVTSELAAVYQVYVAGTDDPYPAERIPMVRALAGETVHCDDMEIRRPDGTVVPLELWATPVAGHTGWTA